MTFGTSPVRAATHGWNVFDGNWNVAGNWFPSGVPGAGDTVNIGPFFNGVARTVTYNYTGPAVTLAQLTVDLTGMGAAATTLSMPANNLTSSNEYIGLNGRGVLDQSGGVNTVAAGTGFLDVGVFAGSTGTYNLSGNGSLTANTNEYIGDVGTGFFNQTGGTNAIIGGAGHDLYLGYNAAGGAGTYTLSAGRLDVSNFSIEFIGYAKSGTFNQSGGTNTGDTIELGFLAGSTGTYTLSGGVLGGLTEIVGGFGNGTFNQTGGSNNVHNLNIASRLGSTGTYNLSGGSLNNTGINNIRVGGDISSGGSGGLNVSGTGILSNIHSIDVFTTPGSGLNQSGGTINTVGLNFNGDPARFNWTGGELNITTNVTWDSAAAATSTSAAFGAALALGTDQTLMITGNETLGGAGAFGLTLNSGGTHQVTGTLTIATNGSLNQNALSTLSAPTITQAGGAVNGTLQNQATFIYQSGLFNGRLINQGTISFSPSFTTGNGLESDTSLTVTTGQTLTANGAGLDNHSLLTVDAGGNLVATSATNQSELIVNGSFTATTFTNTTLLHGVGQLSAATTNAPTGDVRVVAGELLRFAGASFTNQGLVEAIGNAASPAKLEFNTPVTNAPSTGLITGRNNLLRFNAGLTNDGSVAISVGTSDLFGDISNSATGKIVVSGGAGVTFYDDIVQNGVFRVSKVGSTTSVAVVFGSFSGTGGSTGGGDIFFEGDLRPGNSPASVTFGNNIALGSGASINIELAGATAGSQYDQVHVTGQLALDGTLKVSLENFNPSSGQSFDILDWGSLTGTFNALQLPALASGLLWDTSQLYTTGMLSVAGPGLAGDYNHNGIVDAPDYVVWRKGLGTTFSQTDYDVWRGNYGRTAGSGSAATAGATVPEPTTLVLLMFAATGWRLRRRRSA